MASDTQRRMGDALKIEGDYQYRALNTGHPVQRFWHLSKQLAIGQFLAPSPGDFVLDVGCGSGVISQYLGRFGAEVLGVDGNAAAVEFAQSKFASDNVAFRKGFVDEHLVTPRPAQKIYCLEVIEHLYLEQGIQMLRVFCDLLAPGGRALLTTPNYHSLWPLIEWGMDRFSGAAHMDGEQHVCHYTPSLLKNACAQAGFQVDVMTTFCFLAPWLASISWNAASALHQCEVRNPLRVGSLLLVVLTKPAS